MEATVGSASGNRASNTLGLSKNYGEGRGLFDLDLEVRAGEIFGYLGPNGAGKTTTVRLLMVLARPTRGSASRRYLRFPTPIWGVVK